MGGTWSVIFGDQDSTGVWTTERTVAFLNTWQGCVLAVSESTKDFGPVFATQNTLRCEPYDTTASSLPAGSIFQVELDPYTLTYTKGSGGWETAQVASPSLGGRARGQKHPWPGLLQQARRPQRH